MNNEGMILEKLILNIVFKYRCQCLCFVVVLYFILLLFFMRSLSFDNILGSLIFLYLLVSSIWNDSFVLLGEIHEDSPSGEIIGRGILIFTFLVVMIYLMTS